MKCLDTTYLIDLERNDKKAVDLASELDFEGFFCTTEINVFEIFAGLEQTPLKDTDLMDKTELLFQRITVLPLGRSSARHAARIIGEMKKKGKPIDTLDALVAGICRSHGCDTIITRNTKHFANIDGIKVEEY